MKTYEYDSSLAPTAYPRIVVKNALDPTEHVRKMTQALLSITEKGIAQWPRRCTISLFVFARKKNTSPVPEIENTPQHALRFVNVLRLSTCIKTSTYCTSCRLRATEEEGLPTIFKHQPSIQPSTRQNPDS